MAGGSTADLTGDDLFAITASVTEPGSVTLDGQCSNYIKSETDIAACSDSNKEYPCASQETKTCEINENGEKIDPECIDGKITCTIGYDTVDEYTMTIEQLAECQNAEFGFADPDCKCFVNPITGYSTSNGLPNTRITDKIGMVPKHQVFKTVIATTLQDSHPDNTAYKGCGFQPSPEDIFEEVTFKGDPNSNTHGNLIVWRAADCAPTIGNNCYLYYKLKPDKTRDITDIQTSINKGKNPLKKEANFVLISQDPEPDTEPVKFEDEET